LASIQLRGFFGYLHAARFYEYLSPLPEPNAKCAFWVKLCHKPRAANATKKGKTKNYILLGCWPKPKAKQQSEAARNPRYGHNANL